MSENTVLLAIVTVVVVTFGLCTHSCMKSEAYHACIKVHPPAECKDVVP